MAKFARGDEELSFGFSALAGDVSHEDRQCAWELYAHMITRVAVRGKVGERGEDTFKREVLADSLESLRRFYLDARAIMVRYPVGRAREQPQEHLGFFMARMLELVIDPFLEKWQPTFEYWWEENKTNGSPYDVQTNFPQLDEMLDDWIAVRRFGREAIEELAHTYAFVDVSAAMRIRLE